MNQDQDQEFFIVIMHTHNEILRGNPRHQKVGNKNSALKTQKNTLLFVYL